MIFPVCVWGQSNHNLSLVGSYNWDGAGYDSEGSDIWGWIDPSTGVEYALVGLNEGFSVIDLSTPQSPTEIFFIPDVDDTWRDIYLMGLGWKVKRFWVYNLKDNMKKCVSEIEEIWREDG